MTPASVVLAGRYRLEVPPSAAGQTVELKASASGLTPRTVQVKLVGTLTGHADIIASVAISPDGQTLVSGSYDKTIKVWGA